MKIALPYSHSFAGQELRYALRGIERFVNQPEVIIIGDIPKWTRNVHHIHFKERRELRWKERNIYEKLKLIKEDFLYFNDDHYLLQPFTYDYHYTGTLMQQYIEYKEDKNPFAQTIKNTLLNFVHPEEAKNYYRHQPMLINYNTSFTSLECLDWDKEWGYCIKSIYCHREGIEGSEYPDLKIRTPLPEKKIKQLIEGREYFSTGEGAMNRDMFRVLNNIYPQKSKFE